MHSAGNFEDFNVLIEINEESIQMWLIEQIGLLTGLSPSEIDITETFSAYGIDSVAAAGLSGELATWLGEQLPPTITWDYPTVDLLASHLALMFARQRHLAA